MSIGLIITKVLVALSFVVGSSPFGSIGVRSWPGAIGSAGATNCDLPADPTFLHLKLSKV